MLSGMALYLGAPLIKRLAGSRQDRPLCPCSPVADHGMVQGGPSKGRCHALGCIVCGTSYRMNFYSF